jgi:hypothetical protein
MMSSSFKDIVNKIPGYDWEDILSMGLSHFIREQEPKSTEFEKVANGYVLKVRTDERNAQEAKQFWQNYVLPKLGDNNE